MSRGTCLLMFAIGVLAAVLPVQAANVYIGGLAPNWEQPYDYPDPLPFDNTGPGPRPAAPPRPWDAWCTPSAAACMMGHWADVRAVAGAGDAFADGNQGVLNGYLGTKWTLGPDWHDYKADGTANRPAPGPYPPAAVTDLGWYMNTNNSGCNNLAFNPGVIHAGTYVGNTDEGLNKYLTHRGSTLAGQAKNFYVVAAPVNPNDLTFAQAVAMIRSEIDANRTVLGHFKWWVNPQGGPGGPGNGTGAEDSEDDFESSGGFGLYPFDLTNPGSGPNGAPWNNDDGAGNLGHTVCFVGYTTDGAGNTTHLIAHDNWPATVRNVQVALLMQNNQPIPLTAITVVPEPTTMLLLVIGGVGLVAGRVRRKGR